MHALCAEPCTASVMVPGKQGCFGPIVSRRHPCWNSQTRTVDVPLFKTAACKLCPDAHGESCLAGFSITVSYWPYPIATTRPRRSSRDASGYLVAAARVSRNASWPFSTSAPNAEKDRIERTDEDFCCHRLDLAHRVRGRYLFA